MSTATSTSLDDILAWRDCTYTFTLDQINAITPRSEIVQVVSTSDSPGDGYSGTSHKFVDIESHPSPKAPLRTLHQHGPSADSSHSSSASEFTPLIYQQLADTLAADDQLSEMAANLPHPVRNPVPSGASHDTIIAIYRKLVDVYDIFWVQLFLAGSQRPSPRVLHDALPGEHMFVMVNQIVDGAKAAIRYLEHYLLDSPDFQTIAQEQRSQRSATHPFNMISKDAQTRALDELVASEGSVSGESAGEGSDEMCPELYASHSSLSSEMSKARSFGV